LPPSGKAGDPTVNALFHPPCDAQYIEGWAPVRAKTGVRDSWWAAAYTKVKVDGAFLAMLLKYNPKRKTWGVFQRSKRRTEAHAKAQAYRWYCNRSGIPWK
jgi:hypothetical protein